MVAARSTAFDWEIQNKREFEFAIDRLSRATDDFRIPFTLISKDWYKSNRQLFTLQSSGLYQDLAPAKGVGGNPTTTTDYKQQKLRMVGHIYPIFDGKTGKIKRALLNPGAKETHNFVGRKSLEMGIDDEAVPYAIYHQSDKPREVLPQRKLVFITGGPADRSRDSRIAGRRERWLKIIGGYINEIMLSQGFTTGN